MTATATRCPARPTPGRPAAPRPELPARPGGTGPQAVRPPAAAAAAPPPPAPAAELAPAPVRVPASAPPAGGADLLDYGYLGACLRALAGGLTTPQGCQAYLDRVAAGAADPVERMLLEQTALAHVQLARLRAVLAAAEGDEAIDRLAGAVARLAAEFRRTAVAVEEYRGARAARLGTA